MSNIECLPNLRMVRENFVRALFLALISLYTARMHAASDSPPEARDATLGQEADAATVRRTLIEAIRDPNADAARLEHLAEVYKSITEADRLSAERESEGRKFFWAQITPLLTSTILAGTLIFQIIQFRLTSKQQADQARTTMELQVNANEDTQWREGLKIFSVDTPIAQQAGIAFLQTFFSNRTYGVQSRHLALQVLVKSHSEIEFIDSFRALFSPIRWSDLDDVVLLDRDISSRYEVLDHYQHRTTTQEADHRLYFVELASIGRQLGTLFRSPKPTGQALDLSVTRFYFTDFSQVKLDGAILTNTGWYSVKLIGADLSNVGSWDGLNWSYTAWWRAHRIRKELLSYLEQYFPFSDKSSDYSDSDPGVNKTSYQAEVARLERAASPTQ